MSATAETVKKQCLEMCSTIYPSHLYCKGTFYRNINVRLNLKHSTALRRSSEGFVLTLMSVSPLLKEQFVNVALMASEPTGPCK